MNGVLKIPLFVAFDEAEIVLRSIMAFEQCHHPFTAHVCNYIIFLDFLIDSEKDVDLLVEKGIISNGMGNSGALAKMVNKLCLGIVDDGSYYYSETATGVIDHYNDKWNKSRSILKNVYFNNLWRGTATVTATLLLVLTLIQTATSIIQTMHK